MRSVLVVLLLVVVLTSCSLMTPLREEKTQTQKPCGITSSIGTDQQHIHVSCQVGVWFLSKPGGMKMTWLDGFLKKLNMKDGK